MNDIIETILNHRSIRKFEDKLLTDEQIRTIIESAQAASTSSFIQAYSIIGVKDKGIKNKLAELAGNQSYVSDNGHFFIFCADFHRHEMIANMEGKDIAEAIESTEKFMVACIDAALASQNAVLAAESMGLGICYIGGLRNNLEEVGELLKVPKRVIPLFGLAVGYPTQNPDKKQRLPLNNIYHEDGYNNDETQFKQQIEVYNKQISAYYKERTKGKREDTWGEQIANALSKPTRMYMKDYVQKQGFNLR